MYKPILLTLIGALDAGIVGWIVLSSIRIGNIAGGKGYGGRLVYRDTNPVAFWTLIGFYTLVGLAIFGALFWALVVP